MLIARDANRPPMLVAPTTHPVPLVLGFAAARSGRPLSANPYALGLPCDNEQSAALWDEGHRLAPAP